MIIIRQFKLLTIIIFFGFTIMSQAQESNFGLKGGVNFSVLNTDNVQNNLWKLGFNGGVVGEFMINKSVGVQSEIIYSIKGGKSMYDENFLGLNIIDGETRLALSYIEVPMYLSYYLSQGFNVHVGPYVGFLMNTKVETDAEILEFANVDDADQIDNDYFNKIDYGFSGGITFVFDPLFLGVDYSMGLQQVANSEEATNEILGNAKNHALQLYIGVYLK
ncbi:MAG: PorT family protein [Bacteroidetes bacterium]|nr:PorT family protein [Bacteroidota bacterium]